MLPTAETGLALARKIVRFPPAYNALRRRITTQAAYKIISCFEGKTYNSISDMILL